MDPVSAASLMASLAALVLAWKVKRDSDRRERALVPYARSLTDTAGAILHRMNADLGGQNRWVQEYQTFTNSLVCALGSLSKEFARTWIDAKQTEEEKEEWRQKFGMNNN